MEASDDELRSYQGEELDCTERLPDELVVKLLSGFTLKEAARTSILSRRWRNLWKSADFLVLDFDAMKEVIDLIGPFAMLAETVVEKRRWYMSWVNEVVTQLQQHRNASQLRKFRLAFNLTNDCNSEGDIDRWLLFAMSKRVESLDLALDTSYVSHKEAYVFSKDCFSYMKTPVGLSGIKLLRSLRLLNVEVRDEIIEHVIANCPSLEELAIQSSRSLTQLRVVGSSHLPLRLKLLDITSCYGLTSLEIDHAPHLVKFIYGCCGTVEGEGIRVGYCPHLVDLSLLQACLFRAFSGCASKLESLHIKIGLPLIYPIWGLVEHTSLKQLTVEAIGSGCIFGLTSLINKCPRLHTLQLFLRHAYRDEEDSFAHPDLVKIPRESIKVVKIVGFNGHRSEVQFVDYVMEYFLSLETMVIDLSRPDSVLTNDLILLSKEDALCKIRERMAREAAFRFKSRAGPTLKVSVI